MSTIEVIQFRSLEPGPRVIFTGAVHGNEVCGTLAIREVAMQFMEGRRRLRRGAITFVPVCNPVAHALGRREGDRNLNRDFRPAIVMETAEDRIATELAPLLVDHDVLVDLHSFRTAGPPFVFIGPPDNDGPLEAFAHAATEAELALAVGPDRVVHGWLATYAAGALKRPGGSAAYGVGTTEFMRHNGGAAITVECGRHEDPEAIGVARRAIDAALWVLGVEEPTGQAVQPADPERTVEQIELYEVHDRLDEGDRLAADWKSFDRVEAGRPLAHRADGTVVAAPVDGYVVFPNADTPVGKEWFYLARPGTRDLRGTARSR